VAAPPLLLERSPGAQIALAVGVPAALGAIAGVLVGVNEVAYTALGLLLLIGAIGAGYEHPGGDEAALRGLCAGSVYGSVLLMVHAIIGNEAKASLPHPHAGLVIGTAVASMLAAAIGGILRRRHERREQQQTVAA
jgi:hypothetical protein